MNWNDNNNGPWGSGGGNNPWGGGSNKDFEDTIKKAKDRFGKFKFGGRRNLSILLIVGLGKTSPLYIQTLTPIFPKSVEASAILKSMSALKV